MAETNQPAPTAPPATTPAESTTTPQTSQTSSATPALEQSLLNQEAPPPAQAAPEAYADFKLPDGYTFDKAALAEATPIFKELGLSQEGAQKLVDLYAKQIQAQSDGPYKMYQEQRKTWQGEVEAKYGQQLRSQVIPTIGRAIALMPTELQSQFRQAMDVTGAGDNPAFVEFIYELSKRAVEARPPPAGATPINGQASPSAPRTAAQAMYPNLPTSATAS